MHKKFYLCRMSFLRYDSEHFLLFLSEQRVENYHPDTCLLYTSDAADDGCLV